MSATAGLARYLGSRDWRATTGLSVCVIVGVGLMVVGILSGRLPACAVAAAILLGCSWDWLDRPTQHGQVQLGASTGPAADSRVGAVISWDPAPGVDGLWVRVSAPGHRASQALLAAVDGTREVRVSIASSRTGQRPIFTVDHAELPGLRLLASPGDTLVPLSVTVLPRTQPLGEVPLPYRLAGLTGPHDSRRPGDGNDLRDIDRFRPGDRLRRIDWRTSARRSTGQGFELYARRTYATADAAVILVLDSRDEVGPQVSTWGDSSRIAEADATSLDNARAAALSLARRYLLAGDRVGLADLGRMSRPVPPAGGRRQLSRLALCIALAEPEGEPRAHRRPPRLPSGALIYVMSTFLDDETSRLAQLWHGSGHRVVAVDVLGEPQVSQAPDRLVLAYRIIAMERADRLAGLARSGVEVVRWADAAPTGAGLPAARPMPEALATLARMRRQR